LKHLLLYLLLLPLSVAAQKDSIPELEADRPDQTETPSIVPKRYFQFETGFVFERTDPRSKQIVHPSTLWKYGLNGNIELRLITELNTIKEAGTSVSGLIPIAIGFKTKISEEKGLIPKTSLIAHMNMRSLASKEFQTEKYAPEFRFTMQHTLSSNISLGYNLGMEWDGESNDPEYIYTLTSGFGISEKFGCYIELYGFAAKAHTADHRFDAGITYLPTDWLMLDASGGFGVSKTAPQNFFGMGFTVRVHQ
jgi:hypothetical protein